MKGKPKSTNIKSIIFALNGYYHNIKALNVSNMATSTAERTHTEFAKELGLKEAISLAVGAMIGGGIFSVLGRLAGLSGPFAVVSFFLGGIISFLTAHSYVKLITKYPSAGGEFVILRRGFNNPLIGNSVGALLWLGYSVTIALYAFTFGLYTAEWIFELTGATIQFFNPSNLSLLSFRRFMAAFVVFLFMFINLKGVKESGNIQNVIVAFKLGVLLLLAIVGLFFIKTGNFVGSWNSAVQNNGGGELSTLFSGIFVGGAIIFVSYEGFQVIANTVEELKNPARDVRKAMYISVITVSITYMAVTFVTIGLVDGEINEAALIQAVEFLGPIAITLITLGAIASTSSAINATLLGSSRLAYIMSDWQAFPKKLAVISKRTKVPYLAVIITSMISLLFTFLGNANVIAEVASIIFLFIFLSINIGVLKIYKNESNWPSRLAVGLIIFDIILAFYYLTSPEQIQNSIITFIVLAIFTTITVSWMTVNQILQKSKSTENVGYQLKPLGSELIKEFAYSDSSDEFFVNLDRMLVPIAGKAYETKNIEVSAYIAAKYRVHVTLLYISRNGNGVNKKLLKAKAIMDEFNIDYSVINRKKENGIANTIVKVYREGNFDLINLASRRKSHLFDRLLEKSVSKNVVKQVNCTVLQVHPPRYDKEARGIGDMFMLLDGTHRDSYLARWAKLISSVGVRGRIFSYHVLQLPTIFPLDEAPKIAAIKNSETKFNYYATKLGKIYGLSMYPVFLYGHSLVKAMKGETTKYKPSAILLGHTKDKGLRYRLRTPLSYRIMKSVDSTVIVHHTRDRNIKS